MTRLRERGELFTRRKFGWTHIEDGRCVECPEEQETIRRIVELRDELGMTLRAIAELLNEDSVAPPEGSQWFSGTVGRIARRFQTQAI